MSEFCETHAHSEPWPAEWIAAQKAEPFAGAEAERILGFIQARGNHGFTPNMYCSIVSGGDETRIMAVRRRFYDLKLKGLARMHPEGVCILNAAGNPVTAWVPGRDPEAGLSKYQRAQAELREARSQISRLTFQIQKLESELRNCRQMSLEL